jgi:hypothetical protein
MAHCFNCGKEIPDWYQPKLCDHCLGQNLLDNFSKKESDPAYLKSTDSGFVYIDEDHEYDSLNEEISNINKHDHKLVPKLIEKDNPDSSYKLSFDRVIEILNNQVNVHILLLTMTKERSSTLINNLCCFGGTSFLAKDISNIIQKRNIVWFNVFNN